MNSFLEVCSKSLVLKNIKCGGDYPTLLVGSDIWPEVGFQIIFTRIYTYGNDTS